MYYGLAILMHKFTFKYAKVPVSLLMFAFTNLNAYLLYKGNFVDSSFFRTSHVSMV